MTVTAVVSPSLGVLLSCNQGNFTCAGGRVSCRCDEAVVSLAWRVQSTDTVFSAIFFDSTDNETSDGVFTAVVCDVRKIPFVDDIMVTSYTSKLNFVLMETVTVICNDNGAETSTVHLQRSRRLKGENGDTELVREHVVRFVIYKAYIAKPTNYDS